MNPENMSSGRPEAGTPPVLNFCAGRQGGHFINALRYLVATKSLRIDQVKLTGL